MDLQALFSTLPTLQTARLTLREMKPKDRDGVFQVYGDPEVGRLNGWEPLENKSDARRKIKDFRRQYHLKQRVRWGIALRENDQIIGDCAFVHFDFRSDRAEIGFNLARAYWRQGIMKEAATAIIAHGFNVFKFNRIEALVIPENIASQKLLEKLGLEQEGCLKEGGKVRGEYLDILLYGLIKRQWQESHFPEAGKSKGQSH